MHYTIEEWVNIIYQNNPESRNYPWIRGVIGQDIFYESDTGRVHIFRATDNQIAQKICKAHNTSYRIAKNPCGTYPEDTLGKPNQLSFKFPEDK